ncbi:MAG: archaellin/type IV pilin N-terminal domain-containing protein [Dehalococcoidia bacterium]
MMTNKLMRRMHKGQKGITGLETAIILIAFVVVASVFAYTVLSAGLFSTQKSQEAVYSGLGETRSTVELKGGVMAMGWDPDGGNSTFDGYDDTLDMDGNEAMSQLQFTLTNAIKGEPINFTPPTDDDGDGIADSNSTHVVAISYVDEDQRVDDVLWSVSTLGHADDDNLLEADERFQVTVGGSTMGEDGDDLVALLDPDLTSDKEFTIEVKPPTGATLTIERTTPGIIDRRNNLH